MIIQSYFKVTKIAFAEHDYHVLHLRNIETQDFVIAKGMVSDPVVGNIYYFSLEPRKVMSEKEGESFSIKNYDLLTRRHLELEPSLLDVFFDSFLDNNHINFITEAILETYGIETPDILLYDIDRLHAVFDRLKLDDNVRDRYISLFKVDFVRPASLAFMNSLFIKEERASLMWDKFGYGFFKSMKSNPYFLSILGGVTVSMVDALDISDDIHPDSDHRLGGFICNYSDKESYFKGHMYTAEKDLFVHMERVSLKGIVNQSKSRVSRVLDELSIKEYIKRDLVKGAKVYSTKYAYQIEETITSKLCSMLNKPSTIKFDEAKILEKFKLLYSINPTETQKSVLNDINTSDVSVLTGKAGTGKTTAVNLIVCMLEQCQIPYALLSTTGKASKVLAKSTGREAQTVHSYLGFNGYGFTKGDLEERFLVVDEASMMDSYLAYGLLKSIPSGTKVMFVGDNNQLPPVGPGGILDVLCDVGDVPVVELDIVHRQSKESEILNQALRVLDKKSFQPITDSADYKYIQGTDHRFIKEKLLNIYKKSKENNIDCLVLSPMRKGACGVVSINRFLQEKLNRNSLREDTPWFRNDNYDFFEGDRVIIIKNDWNLGVCNGDIGTIDTITDEYISITLDSKETVVMTKNKASFALELAYCLTIHKSQGSEYDVVCVILQRDHQRMLSTNLIYTAFTRASKKLLVFSDEFSRTFRTNDSGKKIRKHSWVRELFPEMKISIDSSEEDMLSSFLV